MPSSVNRRSLLVTPVVLALNCNRNRRKRIAVIPKANADLFFVTIHTGAERAGKDLNVDVTWNGPDKETDYGRQIEIVDVMISQHVDGIAISATDDKAMVAPIERAISAGIPVSIFDSPVNLDNYVSMVATDNRGAGITAARLLGRMVPAGSKIAMIMQRPGGASTVLREDGFEQTIAQEFPGLKIAAKQYCEGDRLKAMAIGENILAANPDLAGIFCSSEAASLGSIRALRTRNLAGKIRLITFDVSDLHIEALRDGAIDAMLVQDAVRIGYEAVRALVDKLNGRTPPRQTNIPARIITKADMEKPDVKALLNPV